jgi:hypothetical protein
MEIDSFDMTSSSASLSRGHTGISARYFYKRQIAEKCATSSIYFFLVKTRQGGLYRFSSTAVRPLEPKSTLARPTVNDGSLCSPSLLWPASRCVNSYTTLQLPWFCWYAASPRHWPTTSCTPTGPIMSIPPGQRLAELQRSQATADLNPSVLRPLCTLSIAPASIIDTHSDRRRSALTFHTMRLAIMEA